MNYYVCHLNTTVGYISDMRICDQLQKLYHKHFINHGIFSQFISVSIHSSHLIMEGCRQILCEAIHSQSQFHKLPKTWGPSVQDILTIFVNYGKITINISSIQP